MYKINTIFITFTFLATVSVGRCVHEAIYRKIKGKHLTDSTFKRLRTQNALHCTSYCSRELSCSSVNFKISGADQGLCELNNKTMSERTDNEENTEFEYLEIVLRVGNDK